MKHFIILLLLMPVLCFGQSSRDSVSLTTNDTTKEEQDKEFITVQVKAQFPGGLAGWKEYLEKNLIVDTPVKHKSPRGKYTVVITFLVDKEGNVSEVRAENDPGYGTAEEAIRVLRKSPKWIPATQNGKNVIYRQKQTITFLVS